ncbi:MAG: hypothetical protein RXO36_04220 [Candidatus Nanopusillus acidilobi]
MDKDYLMHLLTLAEPELYNHIKNVIKPSHYSDGFYLYVHKSNNLPCLVAHIDTVHKQKPNKKDIVQIGDVITNAKGGLGADDRAGVYALLQLKDLPYNLLFTNFEETGGHGVKKAILEISDLLLENTCFIEIDRKGTGHYVDYVGAEQEFLNLFETRGLEKEFGSYSDIYDLSNELGIASVNLACGYYDQHTPIESLNLKELQAVIDFLKDETLIKELSARQYKTEPMQLWYDEFGIDEGYDDMLDETIDYYYDFYKKFYRLYKGWF